MPFNLDGSFSGRCPGCGANVTRETSCPECERPLQDSNQQLIAEEMANGGTRPGEPPGRGFPSPPTPPSPASGRPRR